LKGESVIADKDNQIDQLKKSRKFWFFGGVLLTLAAIVFYDK
jgi:hypothetical protein